MTTTIKKCNLEDLHALKAISEKTFYETFSPYNSKEDMANYLESSFNLAEVKKQLTNPNCLFYFIYFEKEVAGYMKIDINEAQQSFQLGKDAFEIERLYIDQKYHRKGLGKKLINHAKTVASDLKKSPIWLEVWDENEKAKQFYYNTGFSDYSTRQFPLGDTLQKGIMMVMEN